MGTGGLLDAGRSAVASGRWDEAEQVLAESGRSAPGDAAVEVLELQAEVRWWRGDVAGAISAWEDAARLARSAGDLGAAARLAAWISCEYLQLGNTAAGQGWLARASRFLDEAGDDGSAGWVALAGAAAAPDAAGQERSARDALTAARRTSDADLEILALARLGLAEVRGGAFGAGLARFDEAMASATGGEAERLRTVGVASCDLVLATQLTGDIERLAHWGDVLSRFVADRGYPPVMGFCASCCAELEATRGRWDVVEQQLRAAVVGLHDVRQTARCVEPTARLAELLVLQGRLEEAAVLLQGDEGGDTLLARARLALARGEQALAETLAVRVTRGLGDDGLERVAAWEVVVQARLARGDTDGAADAVARMRALVEGTDSSRARARTAVAGGLLAKALGDVEGAAHAFEDAIDAVAGVRGSVEAAQAHLALAQLRAETAPDVARAEARAALRTFQSISASFGADEAAALLRQLGDRSLVGAKGDGGLTQREREVLRLIGGGLTNAELAERLFISTKTAGNHVSSVLSKLGLRSRTEAAAYAVLHPDNEPVA